MSSVLAASNWIAQVSPWANRLAISLSRRQMFFLRLVEDTEIERSSM